MSYTLYQKDNFFNQKEFEITAEGLNINSKKLVGSDELFVKFEDIGSKVIKSKSGNRKWLLATIFFFMLSIGMFTYARVGGDVEKNGYLVYLILSIICFTVFFLTYKKSFYLTNSQNKNAIEFLIDNPSKEELNSFIDTLKSQKNNHLKMMYGQVTKMLSYEQQHSNLQWLYNIEAINRQEYESKLSELNVIFSQTTNPIIGFRNNPSD
jgi:hypothetical protein